jgi:hypothetical protein
MLLQPLQLLLLLGVLHQAPTKPGQDSLGEHDSSSNTT